LVIFPETKDKELITIEKDVTIINDFFI
jgi:hypothetical protein